MIRTTIFFIYFWLIVPLSSPAALALRALDLLGVRQARPLIGYLVRAWARSVLWIMGAHVRVSGQSLLPEEERVCFVSNHQGDLDILLILAHIPRTVGFVTKSQAAWIPFLNIWIWALGSVFIDRKRVAKAHTAIERGMSRIRSGAAMVIFPEGTRSRGPLMGPFHNGSFKLATRTEACIVPLSIQGTYHAWEEHKRIVPCAPGADDRRSDPHSGSAVGRQEKNCPTWCG